MTCPLCTDTPPEEPQCLVSETGGGGRGGHESGWEVRPGIKAWAVACDNPSLPTAELTLL